MHQLSFPFVKNFGRTLPPREISSVDFPNPFRKSEKCYQQKLDFNSNISLRKRLHKRNAHRKSYLFRGTKQVPCCYCDKPLKYSQATVEHIVQLSMGGTNDISNTTISCGPCNGNRQDFSFEEWRRLVKAGFRDKRPYHFNDPFIRLMEHLKEKNRFLERKYLK